MYKYYNDLIYRQNDGTTKFDKPSLPELHSARPRSISKSPVRVMTATVTNENAA